MSGLITVPTDQERSLAEIAEPQRDRRASGHLNRGSALSKLMQDRHKRVSRMLGYTLVLGEPDAWGDFSVVCRARLTLCERAGLALAALGSLPDDYMLETAAAALGATGDPLPAFLGGMDDARDWASWATESERKAYALACFEAMAPRDQAAFFRHISTVEVAA
jgi:hypothetical protein